MDVNVLTQLIGSLGFPIVCCGALFWRMIKQDTMHKEEMTKFTDAINNNTLVMNELLMTIREERKDAYQVCGTGETLIRSQSFSGTACN